jgi:hypothetical protein
MDFHALAAAPDATLYGQATSSTAVLKSSDSGRTWIPTGANLVIFKLVVDPTGRIIALTTEGPHVSTDQGATFARLVDSPNFYLIASSPDRQRLIGVDNEGVIWSSAAGDAAWRNVGTAHGPAQAITVTDAGAILIVDDSGLSLLPSGT